MVSTEMLESQLKAHINHFYDHQIQLKQQTIKLVGSVNISENDVGANHPTACERKNNTFSKS